MVGDITVSDLYQSAEEIKLQKPIIVALAKTNKRDGPTDATESDTDAIFDEAVCDVAEHCYELAGLEDPPLPPRKLRAVLLQEVRGISQYGEFEDYVGDYDSAELEQFGLERAYEKSTYRKAKNKLEACLDGVVPEAAFIAATALFGNGVPIPETVQNRYELSYEVGPDAANYPMEARDLALYTLVAELLDIVVEHLDLQRDTNATRDLRTVVGAFARSATDDRSVEEYQQRAHHQFDLSSALKGSTIRNHLSGLELFEVREMFDDINQALLDYVINAEGLVAPTMSYDLTDLATDGEESDSHSYRTEDGRWQIASLGITDPELEFGFGLRILKGRENRAAKLKELLRKLAVHTDIGLLMTDREFDGAEDIGACRLDDNDDWLIFAQDYSDTDKGNDDFERLREKLEPGKTAVVESAGYANLDPDVMLVGYSGATEDDDTIEPIRAFYTDTVALPDDASAESAEEVAETIQDLNFTYNQRAKIETLFRLSKNDFDVATESDNVAKQAFYTNMSMLFYNLYKIVNTVPAPNSGLELTTTQKELLAVIQNLAFDGPRQPAAQTHLQDQS
ncbi:hypothetical protein [Halobacterium sp. CBA1126]|uniref:hypothetical protein n=1 Tax=Halobacterium sp. CBA1126 TaxID=2668074 RepID=UPI0018D24BAB|nr:hypothetical protein [Halobacterium sp. CBA1126]